MDFLPFILILLCGLFSIAGGAYDWDFFMNSRKARFFVAIFGRNGARAFYICLGVILVIIAVVARLS
ncbi:MAG: immunity 17 family protein [Candidatus Wallbacteria bacterium]